MLTVYMFHLYCLSVCCTAWWWPGHCWIM